MELSKIESFAIKEKINAISKKYMDKYKYLSAITARKFKSEEGDHLCIVMYVHPCTDRYSSIPINEEPIPSEIDGYKVVVRNGVFKAATNTADAYHANLRMGCKITSNLVDGHGTLGGFINHPEYGLCGFTCAHVVFSVTQMRNLKKAKRLRNLESIELCLVYQPSTEYVPIGRVVEAVYTEGDSHSAGVDLALFQIENRHPRSGTFPSGSHDGKLQYVTGETWGRTRISCGACEVQKFGVTTGFTSGKVLFDGMSVRSLAFASKAVLAGVDSILYNQYEIVNESSNFCEPGDSGGLVLMKDYTDELAQHVCIGMVNGALDSENPKHGVVTPITDILQELKVQNLKSFRKELTREFVEKKIAEIKNDVATMQNEILSQISNMMAKSQH